MLIPLMLVQAEAQVLVITCNSPKVLDQAQEAFLIPSGLSLNPPRHVQAEAQELIITCDCPQYLAKAEKRLQEEAQRVALYLDPTTEAKVVHVAETALIQQQVSSFPSSLLILSKAWSVAGEGWTGNMQYFGTHWRPPAA